MSKVKKETMWMAWSKDYGFINWIAESTKRMCQDRIACHAEDSDTCKAVRVEIREVKKRKAVKRGKS